MMFKQITKTKNNEIVLRQQMQSMESATRTTSSALWCGLLLVVLAVAGCDGSAYFQFNHAYLDRQVIDINSGRPDDAQIEISDEQEENVSEILEAAFGTPDAPKIPGVEGAAALLDQEFLDMAAGPVGRLEDGSPRGLYRQHCAHCHGVTGDGMGPTSEFLKPYPRDYRKGVFKFKHTVLGAKPRKEDLRQVLMEGIPGTAMPSFRVYDSQELDAIIDYVIYLAIRGDVERQLEATILQKTADEDGNPLLADTSADASAEDKEGLLDAKDIITDVVASWTEANDSLMPTTEPPANWQSDENIARGREIFLGTGGCVACHGKTGLGDGNPDLFDTWTEELVGAKGQSTSARLEFYDEHFAGTGTLKPRNQRPRNLRLGSFRGGRRPIDIYSRISQGIAGTEMPGGKAKGDDAWAVVAYVLSLSEEVISKPSNDLDFQRERN